MKKLFLIIFSALLFTVMIEVNAAAAPSITKASYIEGRIKIEGTGEGELQLVLFGLDNSPLYLTTVTAEKGLFEITLPAIDGLKEGTYNIKVSNYDGEETALGTVLIKAEVTPKTVDNLTIYVGVGAISLVVLVGSSYSLYKANKERKNKK